MSSRSSLPVAAALYSTLFVKYFFSLSVLVVLDVAAERQLNAIERLLAFLPRRRGFRVNADASVSIYPARASPRARLPAEKREGYTPGAQGSVNRARSRRGASVLRTHAPAAALHARRSTPKGVSRRNFACSSSPASDGEGAALAARTGRLDRLYAGPDGLCPSPQLATARCPCSGPRRASAAGAQQPRRVHALSLLSREAHAPHAGRTPGPPKRLPPPRARPRRKGASRGPSLQPSPPPPHRRPTPPWPCASSPRRGQKQSEFFCPCIRPLRGLEPRTPRLEVWCAVHCATGACRTLICMSLRL